MTHRLSINLENVISTFTLKDNEYFKEISGISVSEMDA